MDDRPARLESRIWLEEPAPDNPYVAGGHRLHGYDLLELLDTHRFSDVWFLLFGGELPSPPQRSLLEALLIGLIGPGPRHPASRAVMTAAASLTDRAHLLPIGAALLGGDHLGVIEVWRARRFMDEHLERSPEAALSGVLDGPPDGPTDRLAPGFGTRFGSRQPWPETLLKRLAGSPGAGAHLEWAVGFADAIERTGNGALIPAVAAAALADLGFEPWPAACLFQLMHAHGVLAHGLEYIGKRAHELPFLEDEQYVIDTHA